MSMGTNDARLKLTPEEEAKLVTMDHNEIISYLHSLEVAKGLTVPDVLNGSVFHELTPVETQQAAPKFKIKLAGVEYTADTLEELNAQYEPALKAAVAAHDAAQDSVARNANGRFAKQPSVTDGADKISNSLVAKMLKDELGIEPQELQASVASIRQDNQYVSNWADASKAFLKANPDYTGNEETVKAIGERVMEMGLDEKPSVEALQKAYDSLAEEAQRYLALQDAQSPEEIAQILGIDDRRVARQTSAQWGKH